MPGLPKFDPANPKAVGDLFGVKLELLQPLRGGRGRWRDEPGRASLYKTHALHFGPVVLKVSPVVGPYGEDAVKIMGQFSSNERKFNDEPAPNRWFGWRRSSIKSASRLQDAMTASSVRLKLNPPPSLNGGHGDPVHLVALNQGDLAIVMLEPFVQCQWSLRQKPVLGVLSGASPYRYEIFGSNQVTTLARPSEKTYYSPRHPGEQRSGKLPKALRDAFAGLWTRPLKLVNYLDLTDSSTFREASDGSLVLIGSDPRFAAENSSIGPRYVPAGTDLVRYIRSRQFPDGMHVSYLPLVAERYCKRLMDARDSFRETAETLKLTHHVPDVATVVAAELFMLCLALEPTKGSYKFEFSELCNATEAAAVEASELWTPDSIKADHFSSEPATLGLQVPELA